MTVYTVGVLARAAGLARSTLLYYDRIGLLPPSRRSTAGYRLYGEDARARLETIRTYRSVGLGLREIRALLDSRGGRTAAILTERLDRLNHEIAGLREQQRKGVLGGRDDVRLGRVDDHHAELGRTLDVHVVKADSGATDHDELVGGLQRRGVDLGRRADDERVRSHDCRAQFFGGQPQSDVDVVARVAQLLESRVGDLLGYQYSRHLTPFSRTSG